MLSNNVKYTYILKPLSIFYIVILINMKQTNIIILIKCNEV